MSRQECSCPVPPVGTEMATPWQRIPNIDLAGYVERAYLHVPAVELSVIPRRSTFRSPRRFVLIQQPSSEPQSTWPEAALRVSALTAAPRMPTPSPAC
jgi:hypothetical protein